MTSHGCLSIILGPCDEGPSSEIAFSRHLKGNIYLELQHVMLNDGNLVEIQTAITLCSRTEYLVDI